MKSTFSLVLVFVLISRSLWPVAEYWANFDYIAKVLCINKDKPALRCNGQCYLAKKLAQDSEDRQDQPVSGNSQQTQISFTYLLPTVLLLDNRNLEDTQQEPENVYRQNYLSSLYALTLVDPPEALLAAIGA